MEILTLYNKHELWAQASAYAEACSWSAGKKLSQLMNNNGISDYERVFVALENGNIAGYCTLLKTDCIPDVLYSPYIGFVFVGEDYRGKRISEKLCGYAFRYAKSLGFEKVYLVSGEVNLYEKYGFIKIDEKLSDWGAMQSIYLRTV